MSPSAAPMAIGTQATATAASASVGSLHETRPHTVIDATANRNEPPSTPTSRRGTTPKNACVTRTS